MDGITASEIAGLGVGALIFSITIAAPKVDAFVAASQRSSLDMCKRCGNLRVIACSECKGVGFTKENGPFGFSFIDDFGQSVGDRNVQVKSKVCTKCSGKGRINCSVCYGRQQA